MHTRSASQRVDLQSGIIGEQISVDEAAIVFRLADGVFFESLAGFVRRRDRAGKLAQIKVRSGELELPSFSRIRRRAVNRH